MYRQCGGEARQKGAMARPTNVRALPRTISVAGGGGTKKCELKENTGANTRENNIKTLSQATIAAGGARQKGENQLETKRWHDGIVEDPVIGRSFTPVAQLVAPSQFQVSTNSEKKYLTLFLVRLFVLYCR